MADGARIAAGLRTAVDEGVALFSGVAEDRTVRRPAADAWCARDVIGHLIDSACNNHRRFIVNQDTERLIVDPYAQEAWVARGRYADAPASELVPLWATYNRHIARVIEAIPDAVLNRPRGPLSGYRFSYISAPTTDFATLGYVADDYVGHIRHHLKQIRTLLISQRNPDNTAT